MIIPALNVTPVVAGGLAPLIDVPGGSGVGFRTTSFGANINMPTGIQENDILAMYIGAWELGSTTPPGDGTPTGWTKLATASGAVDGSGRRISLFGRLAPSGYAGASVAPNMSGADDHEGIVKAWRLTGAPPSSISAVGTAGQEYTTGDPSPQSQAASGQTAPLIILSAHVANNVVNPRTWTPDKGGEIGIFNSFYLAWKAYYTDPQDHTIDMDDEGTNLLISRIMRIHL